MKSKEFEPMGGRCIPRALDRFMASPKRKVAGVDMARGKGGTAVVEYYCSPPKFVGMGCSVVWHRICTGTGCLECDLIRKVALNVFRK